MSSTSSRSLRADSRTSHPSSNILDPWEQGRDYFAKGQLAMVITDFQDLDTLARVGVNWGTTGSPTPDGYDPYFFVWTDSVGIMADSDHPDEAKEFLAFLTTAGQRIRYKTSGDIPLDLSIAEQVDWAKGVPGRQEGLDVLSHARPTNFVPNRWDVVGPFYDAWGYVLPARRVLRKRSTRHSQPSRRTSTRLGTTGSPRASRIDAGTPTGPIREGAICAHKWQRRGSRWGAGGRGSSRGRSSAPPTCSCCRG